MSQEINRDVVQAANMSSSASKSSSHVGERLLPQATKLQPLVEDVGYALLLPRY